MVNSVKETAVKVLEHDTHLLEQLLVEKQKTETGKTGLLKHKGKSPILKSCWTNATKAELYQKNFGERQSTKV